MSKKKIIDECRKRSMNRKKILSDADSTFNNACRALFILIHRLEYCEYGPDEQDLKEKQQALSSHLWSISKLLQAVDIKSLDFVPLVSSPIKNEIPTETVITETNKTIQSLISMIDRFGFEVVRINKDDLRTKSGLIIGDQYSLVLHDTGKKK